MNNLCRYLLLPVITSNHIRSGDKGIRTLDPLLARQVLSQLSYTPIYIKQHECHSIYINICKPYYIFIKSGSHLLSHTVSSIVSSAA